MKKLIFALVLLVATPVWAEDGARQITVVGHGQVEMVPDMATITVGVVSQGKTAADALDENSAALSKVLALFKDVGIEGRDIQTSALSLNPRWNNRGSNPSEPKIIGFVAQNLLTVRLRDLDRVGEVLDAAVQTGANNFQGLHFGVQNPEPAQNAARQNAVKDAMAKAQLYADAAGVTLGDVMVITESPQHGGGPVMRARAMHSEAVPVAQGEISLRASVTMVFAIAP